MDNYKIQIKSESTRNFIESLVKANPCFVRADIAFNPHSDAYNVFFVRGNEWNWAGRTSAVGVDNQRFPPITLESLFELIEKPFKKTFHEDGHSFTVWGDGRLTLDFLTLSKETFDKIIALRATLLEQK